MTFDKNATDQGLIPLEAINFKPTVTLVANVIYETEMWEDAYAFSFGVGVIVDGHSKCNGVFIVWQYDA